MNRLESALNKYVKKTQDIILLEIKKEVIIISDDNSIKKNIEKEPEIRKMKYSIKTVAPDRIMEKKAIQKIIYGYSIIKNAPYSEITGIIPKILVEYSLKNLPQSKKTMFGYALKGREGSKGILDEVDGKTVGRNALIIPEKNFTNFEGFLKFWSLNYKTSKILGMDEKEERKNEKK